jgi:hypothetical protein
MRQFLLIIICILIVPWSITVQTRAQEPETWYFAASEDSGQIVAYTASGQSNVLVESGFYHLERAFRITSDMILAVIAIKGEPGLYKLAPDSIKAIQLPKDAKIGPVTAGAMRPPYVILLSSNIPAGPAAIVNIEKNTFRLLNGDVYNLSQEVPISEDGKLLRYFSRSAPDSKMWVLRERNLESNLERDIYTVNGEIPIVSHDRYGDRWFYSQREQGQTLPKFFWILNDGTTQPVENVSTPIRNIFRDWFFSIDPLCTGNCTVEFTPLVGGDSLKFSLPDVNGSVVPIAAGSQNNFVVIVNGSALWYLYGDGTTQELGLWEPISVFTPPTLTVSRDARWVLALEGTEKPLRYRVWDSVTREFVVERQLTKGVALQINYGSGGFLVTEVGENRQFLYLDSPHLTKELTTEGNNLYFDILPDGTLLYAQLNKDQNRDAGIYRYDPVADSYQLLVKDVRPMFTQASR